MLAARLGEMDVAAMQRQLAEGRLTALLLTKACLLRCLQTDVEDNSGGSRCCHVGGDLVPAQLSPQRCVLTAKTAGVLQCHAAAR